MQELPPSKRTRSNGTDHLGYRDLNEFLSKHSCKSDAANRAAITHTRIGDKESNIYGGSYSIPQEELPQFYELYCQKIFGRKQKEYLTEKQLPENGPMAVDLDFRYAYEVDKRQHTQEDVTNIICEYLEKLKECFVFTAETSFYVYVLEKDAVNRLSDKSITKDGIHFLFGLQVDHVMQGIIRQKMLESLATTALLELPLINTWEQVLDEGITRGVVNWQLFGSRKPNHQPYELTQIYLVEYDATDGEFVMSEKDVRLFDVHRDFHKLSVQNPNNPRYEMQVSILDTYRQAKEALTHPHRPARTGPAGGARVQLLQQQPSDEDDEDGEIVLETIINAETLQRAIDKIMNALTNTEYYIRETHDFTQALPPKFYQSGGSHLENRKVAFALKTTSEKLFLSWVQLRSKADDFDYADIPDLYREWCSFRRGNALNHRVTRKSIMYWLRKENFTEYQRIRSTTLDAYIDLCLDMKCQEYDIAMILTYFFKEEYVCTSYENHKGWYRFRDHRWVHDKALSLREKISTDLYDLVGRRREALDREQAEFAEEDPRKGFLMKRINETTNLMMHLKQTSSKNNILREAAEILYEENFLANMDSNKYLLCFNNGVVDFKAKVFRDGMPEDYLTKCTKINYVALNQLHPTEQQPLVAEIQHFMRTLFPIPDLEEYMWDHLSSCLIGENLNQTFNVYNGSGSNGKSILTDLMACCLGEYKGTVPVTLVTEKRGMIGGTSDEILKLKGVRYAVMQELSKGMKLNEGILKELTGGDPIQCRGLYAESQVFEPQFSLVVCTNNLPEVESNDDGTWRRICKVDFLSKFVSEGETYADTTPYIFPKDKTLKEKLPRYAPVFMAMLVDRAFQTNGIVNISKTVRDASNKYRKNQDTIAAFVLERVECTGNPNEKLGKRDVYQEFKMWFQDEQGGRKVPKGEELYEHIEKRYKVAHKNGGWLGLRLRHHEEEANGAMEGV